MDAHDRESIRRHVKTYIKVFYALLIGTVLTVAVSYIHFGSEDSHAGNVAVALVIASAKALLVAGFFMHLMSEKFSIYVMMGCTAAFFSGLMILTVWATQDVPELTEFHGSAPSELSASSGNPGHVP
jgi:cytochrome c oxidase subunit IV